MSQKRVLTSLFADDQDDIETQPGQCDELTVPGGSTYPPRSPDELERVLDRLKSWWEGTNATTGTRLRTPVEFRVYRFNQHNGRGPG